MPQLRSNALLRGQGCFAADVQDTEQAVLLFLRSPHAHARLIAIATEAARRQPGVLGIWTGADLVRAGVRPLPTIEGLHRPDGSPARSPARHALAVDRVRHVGEAVVAIAARSLDAARSAADTVQTTYEPLPCVIDPWQAARPDSPRTCEELPDNIVALARHGDRAASNAAFDRATHRVSLRVDNQRVAACALEPRGLSIRHGGTGGRLEVTASTQMPTALRDAILQCLPGLDAARLVVRCGDVGGGFGMKTAVYPEDVIACHVAQQLGMSLRWTAERADEFAAALHARDLRSEVELAVDGSGRVLALRVRSVGNAGAYATPMGVLMPLMVAPLVATSVYDIAQVDLEIRAVLTHTAPVGAYRGAGQPEAIHLLERTFDAAADRLGLDRAEFRRRNLVQPAQMPYTSALGQQLDSGDFPAVLGRCLDLADWAGFEARRHTALQRGQLRGRGIATHLKWTGAFALDEPIRLRAHADGVVDIVSGAQEMGQGIATACAQLAADVLQLPLDRLRVLQGDSEQSPGFGSGGSRSVFTGGAAVVLGAQALVLRAKEMAAALLEASPGDIDYQAGQFIVAGTDRTLSLDSVAARQPGGRFEVDAVSHAAGPSWPHACHVCEVEVDPDTGATAVVAYHCVADIGRVVNPALARGQLEGAIVQGIGQALAEQVVYREDGQLLTGSLLDYALPRAADVPWLRTALVVDQPCRTNTLGAKGAGELGTIGAVPAVAGAVIDAVRHAGVGAAAHELSLPLSPGRVWRALGAGAHD